MKIIYCKFKQEHISKKKAKLYHDDDKCQPKIEFRNINTIKTLKSGEILAWVGVESNLTKEMQEHTGLENPWERGKAGSLPIAKTFVGETYEEIVSALPELAGQMGITDPETGEVRMIDKLILPVPFGQE
jgi:hypothetical protein